MRQEKDQERSSIIMMLSLFFLIVTIISVFTIRSNIKKIEGHNISDDIDNGHIAEAPVDRPVPTVDSRDSKKGAGNDKSSGDDVFSAPLQGSVISPYSPDDPVYSKTLDQYMTHYGVDIAAEKGAHVRAAGAGTVTKVYKDDKYGDSIEVTHSGGIKTVYSNLSAVHVVETGDKVSKGQVISSVGDSSLFESLDETHLHFEVMKGEEHIDPSFYISF